MPAMSTPQAAALPAVGNQCASSKVAIMQILSRIGAPAAAAKRPLALSSPEIMVCMETSSSEGKVMRVSVTARS